MPSKLDSNIPDITDFSSLSLSETIDLFRQWRESNERNSKDVVDLFWTAVMADNMFKLGNEQYIILEQVLTAGLDLHREAVVWWCVDFLSDHFSGSLRVLRYKAATLEAEKKYDKALEILDHIIKSDETNAAARKRRVAIFKAQGLTADAIKELVDYLKKFMSDVEGWQELCDLYMLVQDYSKAVFCAEELLLHQPHSHLFHQRVADIRYTMGGVENLELAKAYYCQAIKLNPDNIRALLGLMLTTSALLSGKGLGSKRKEVTRLHQWAQQAVARRFGDAATPTTPSIETMLQALSIAE